MRIYNQQNLIEAIICKELNKFSIESHLIRSVLDHLRGDTFTDSEGRNYSFWEYFNLVPKPEFVYLFIAGKDLKSSKKERQRKNKPVKIKSFGDITDEEFFQSLSNPYGEGPVIGIISQKDIIGQVNAFPSTIIINIGRAIMDAGGL